jgi:uncharacterized membrane protein SpoIIM required for sporulation
MVLETFQKMFLLKHKVRELFFIGFLHTTIAIFLGLWVFPEYASIIMVFFIVIPSIPFMLSTLKSEVIKDECMEKERLLLKEHTRILYYYMALFMGITLAFAFWYVVLPAESTQITFNVQSATISRLGTMVTANVTAGSSAFMNIFLNNLKVLTFCILFSFCYGVGAMFILAWNASVLGAAIGNFIRTEISKYAGSLGFAKASAYFQIISLGLLKYSIHGIPEILAYFTAGLAGGIISVAVTRQNFSARKFFHTIFDSFDLIMLSLCLIVIAALLEVYVTPLVFG